MDIHGQNLSLELSGLLLLRLWRFFVLLDVKLSEQHDGFFPEDASGDRVRLVDAGTKIC